MKKEKDIKAVVFTALLLITTAILVIIIGLNLPEKTETIQGQVETTDYRVSGKVTSRIVEFRVKEGDMVHTGDTLVILYAPEIDAKLAQAQAAVTAAKAMENKAINGGPCVGQCRKEMRKTGEMGTDMQKNRGESQSSFISATRRKARNKS